MLQKGMMFLSGVCVLISWLWGSIAGIDPAWIAIVVCGVPIAITAGKELWEQRSLNSDVLVTIAIIAATCIGELLAAAEVAFIMMIGMWLEEKTVAKATSALKEMVEMAPEQARVMRGGQWIEAKADSVLVGELVLVKPGEQIPVDGIVVAGQAAIDQAILTGESLPVEKRQGDEVFVGTTNTNGSLEIQTTRVGEETAFAKVTRLVEEAMEKRAPVQRLLDKWAVWIVGASLLLAILVYLVTNDMVRSVTVLIVFCPCALVLATPTAIMAGIGNAAKNGILIKSGVALEQLGSINTVLFDKTGTLTKGALSVAGIAHAEHSAQEVMRWAAALEQHSEHPIATAILHQAKKWELELPAVESFIMHAGSGIEGVVEGKRIYVGNPSFIKGLGIGLEQVQGLLTTKEKEGKTNILIASEHQLLGLISVSDQLRPEARETVETLTEAGVEVAVVTGDNKGAARFMAEQLGITQVYAEQMPDMKYMQVERQLKAGRKVAMIGDGINDAPALTLADVGISMGVHGTQIAAQASDVVLMSNDLRKIADVMRLGQKAVQVIRENLIISTAINSAAILLALLGVLGPVFGAFVHNITSVLVVLNSARLIGFLSTPKNSRPSSPHHGAHSSAGYASDTGKLQSINKFVGL